MNLKAIGIVYRKEFREWIRDRRTLISTVLVPLLIFPLLIVGVFVVASVMVGKAEKEIPSIMIVDGQNAPEIVAKLEKLDTFRVVTYAANYKEQISNREIRAALEIPDGFQSSLKTESPKTVEIYFYDGELKSSMGANRLEKFLKDYRDDVVRERLASKNVPASVLTPFEVRQQNVAPPEKVSGATIGSFVGYMVIILSMTGAMYAAIDLTAGEKERGTMETILSSPVSRLDLVLGKFLLVFSASIVAAILSVTSMGTSFALIGKAHLTDSNGQALQLHLGLVSVVLVFLMAIPLAFLFSAVLMTIALFAKSHKEAQSYLTPITFVAVIPAIASILPGVELTPKLALIPVLNTSLLCKEIITGTYHWGAIAMIFASTCVYAAAALFLAFKTFQRESVLFRS